VDNPFVRKMEGHVRLAPADRAALDGLARQHVRIVAPRQDIEGQHGDSQHTHLVLDGWACRYKQFPDGRRAIVALILPGDLCDPFVFRRARMDHAVGALTPVTVARIAPDQIGEAIRGRPVVEECLWREMLSTTAIHREWIASVGRRSAIERLAHLFCELHLRLGRVGLADGTALPMPVTQPDLADALGQTSVHINRTLKELRNSGLVALRGRRLTIRDLDGLREQGLFDPAYLQIA
jgi:CRP-like cAMP-binding protein